MTGGSANFLSATEAARAIAAGETTSEELLTDCLARIAEYEPVVGAWAWLDPEHALALARAADEKRQQGGPTGPLHGLPVGIKDIIDTNDMPTELGSPLHAGRTPAGDATLVARLREAGAVIIGKTVTAELAVTFPGKTTNPHDATRTPGGSSSGSAAATAAYMVPLAIGTQTNGSVIRPASYCGVFGLKPSHGLISRHGVSQLSANLDTIGLFARGLADLALCGDVLIGYDALDPGMRPRSRPPLAAGLAEAPPMPPHFAFVQSPVWDQAEAGTKSAFDEVISELGERVDMIPLPAEFASAHACHRTIMDAELAQNLDRLYDRGRDQLSGDLAGRIEAGRQVPAVEYLAALELADRLGRELAGMFDDYDAILTPAAPGEAPVGLDSTGSAVFNTIWTLLGLPALNLPVLEGPAGLPLGLQLVGARDDDHRLMRSARWLLETLDLA